VLVGVKTKSRTCGYAKGAIFSSSKNTYLWGNLRFDELQQHASLLSVIVTHQMVKQ